MTSTPLTADDVGSLRGLTEEEASLKLHVEGPNELPTAKSRNLLAMVWEILREPIILLLVGQARFICFSASCETRSSFYLR